MLFLPLVARPILVIACIILSGWGVWQARPVPVGYWVWAGVTVEEAPANGALYIYQGLITRKGQGAAYQRLGLYAHTLHGREVYLSYRLEGELPEPDDVAAIFRRGVEAWGRRQTVIAGLQLDFDSPTGKLLVYSDFLQQLRKKLPAQWRLSITGLGDWAMYGDLQAMRAITDRVDELVFQLYQGFRPLPGVDAYIRHLREYRLPFKVGMLARYPSDDYIAMLKANPRFKGVVYFIQKEP